MNQHLAIKQLKELEKLGGEKPMRLAAEGWEEEWQTLIAILMSARTRDEMTVAVAKELFRAYPTARSLGQASAKDVAQIIFPVNFFKNKARFVIGCAQMLDERYNGKPPHDISKLILFPGVGRKTANVFLAEYGAPAIGVDTHVSYISQRIGWTKHRTPEKIEKDLEQLFPRAEWGRVNRTCVRFGKTYQSRRQKDELLERIKS